MGNENKPVENGQGVESRTPEQILTEERNRVKQIHDMCRDFGIDATSLIEEGSTLEEARAFVDVTSS